MTKKCFENEIKMVQKWSKNDQKWFKNAMIENGLKVV